MSRSNDRTMANSESEAIPQVDYIFPYTPDNVIVRAVRRVTRYSFLENHNIPLKAKT